ncbi:unnamed protein product [Cyclocybe aegerita]|uniref:tripeptidyl-peptidase II n=1 Tax=Cyclocybe aegerita TaxID=1973307 RepID=A0A8S0XQF8_CYCAE|nr:unnamed protein product [Cyclocybe aegerita]
MKQHRPSILLVEAQATSQQSLERRCACACVSSSHDPTLQPRTLGRECLVRESYYNSVHIFSSIEFPTRDARRHGHLSHRKAWPNEPSSQTRLQCTPPGVKYKLTCSNIERSTTSPPPAHTKTMRLSALPFGLGMLLLAWSTHALVALSPNAPIGRHHIVHEQHALSPLASGWTCTRRLAPHTILPLRIGLAQQNLHRLEELLHDVSHPESPNYSRHLTQAEVVAMFAPSQETIDAVRGWLEGEGFGRDRMRLSANKGWVLVNATVGEVEELLKAEYHAYDHPSGKRQFGCHSYSVPAHLRSHIDLIKPTVHFNYALSNRQPSHLRKRGGNLGQPSVFRGPKKSDDRGRPSQIKAGLETCDESITPECLRALYSIDYKPKAVENNSYGIVEFTPQAYLAEDLDLFFSLEDSSLGLIGTRPNTVLIDGAVVQTTDVGFQFNGESDLDLEYAMALVAPQPVTLLQTGDLVEGAGFDNWLDAVDSSFCTFEGGDDPEQDGVYPDTQPDGYNGPESCGIVAPPHTVSISYLQDEHTVTSAFANRQCAEYAKLGLLGTSVLHSSGDNGVAGNEGICLDANHQPVQNGTGTVFNPGFPASCPFVTAVGATQINPGSTVNDPEVACEQVIYSGGGFSNIFPLPSFQADAVTTYLKLHPPPYTNGEFNNSGNARAFPDISANGANYVIAVDGQLERVFGTSASSPVVGSIITFVNDARLAAGKRPLGFLNPLIYSPLCQQVLNDITKGGNQGCGTPGFNATEGWDPVTGVGTPNLSKLMKLALALP